MEDDQPRRNMIRCHTCDTTIESMHVHDFVGCNCDPRASTWCAVDGGLIYLKRSFGPDAAWDEFDEPFVRRWQLEHSDKFLTGVHSDTKCVGRPCPIHRRTDHSKRSWVQVWEGGQMKRVSPKTGRHYRDPDDVRRETA